MSGFIHLQRVIETRSIDPQAEAWLVEALIRWDRSGGDGNMLLRTMDCPTTAAKRRQAVRDRWLCAAADELGEMSLAERARRLADAADRFERRLWPAWKKAADAPAHASVVDGCLFLARQAAEFPCTAKQMGNILKEAFARENFQGAPS